MTKVGAMLLQKCEERLPLVERQTDFSKIV
jgi:hypothetical protein